MKMDITHVVFVSYLIQMVVGTLFSVDEESRIKSYINTMIDCKNVTGLSLAAAKNGEMYAEGFGYANRKNKLPVTNSTKMNIGSVTKTLTSMLWAIIISEAKNRNDTRIDWDTKLTNLLGFNFKLNDDCMTNMASLEDFLSHRTGLDSADLMLQAGVPDHMTKENIIQNMKYLESVEKFRDVFHYSNIGYIMVGHLLEVVAHKSWENLLTEKLLLPLNMTSTVFLNEQSFGDLATPYISVKHKGIHESDGKIYNILKQFGPAGSVCSTAQDLAKFLQFLTNSENVEHMGLRKVVLGGCFKRKSILPDEFRSRYTLNSLFPVNMEAHAYGMAWMLSKYRDYDMYFHTGGLYGYSAVLGFIPSQNISVFLNSNGLGDSGFSSIMLPTMYYVFDVLLGLDPWLNETTACTFPSPWKPPADDNNSTTTNKTEQVNIENAERFCGKYNSPLYGDLLVSLINETLTVNYGRLLKGTLSYHAEYIFNLTVLEPLRDVISNDLTVNFDNLSGNLFQRVNFNKVMAFDRIDTNTNAASKSNAYLTVFIFLLFISIIN